MDLIAEQRLYRGDGIAHRDQFGIQTLALVEAFLKGDEGREKLYVGRWIRAADDFRINICADACKPGHD